MWLSVVVVVVSRCSVCVEVVVVDLFAFFVHVLEEGLYEYFMETWVTPTKEREKAFNLAARLGRKSNSMAALRSVLRPVQNSGGALECTLEAVGRGSP